MKKIIIVLILILITIIYIILMSKKSISGTIISNDNTYITIITKNDSIYKFKYSTNKYNIGDDIKITYKGKLSDLNEVQDIDIKSIKKEIIELNYSTRSIEILNSMSLSEKIGQLLLTELPSENQLEVINQYNVGGLLLFTKDVNNMSKDELINKINTFKSASKIPLYIAIDEEGGTVSRLSWNEKVVDTPFLSPQELYRIGGYEEIKKDCINKNNLLRELGINMNLAPVADITTDKNAFMYERSFGKSKSETAKYIETVLSTQNNDVTYVLKHFPGYGNNVDTHVGIAVDNRSYESFVENDFIPFEAGIKKGARGVLVSHNIVTNIENKPASLSPNIHNILRNKLNFDGLIITDNLSMKAITNYDINKPYIEGILAGNNILIVSDYKTAYNEIYNAVLNKEISEVLIDRLVLKIIDFKLKTLY